MTDLRRGVPWNHDCGDTGSGARRAVGSSLMKCPPCKEEDEPYSRGGGPHPRCGNCRKDLPWIVEAGDADFDVVAEQSSTPALIDFWAAWCGPCHVVSPVLDKLAHERAGRVKLVKVDVDKSPALSQRFDIQAIPTMLLIRDGKVVSRQTGAPPAAPMARRRTRTRAAE